ncbi:MAG: OmpH family outer membrane protein [Aeromonadales bacterium]|nr:OmpH family outer membrane protein [Aeromonadales bacterium]
MFKKLAMAAALSLALVSATTATAFAEDAAPKAKSVDVAVVNLRLIMAELPQAKAASEELQKEFGPRSEELQKIQQEGQKLEAQLQNAKGDDAVKIQRKLASMKSEYDLKAQALQEDSQKKERTVEIKLAKLVQTAIDRIAKERGISLVLRGESVVFATDAVDISRDVIERASKLKEVKKESK